MQRPVLPGGRIFLQSTRCMQIRRLGAFVMSSTQARMRVNVSYSRVFADKMSKINHPFPGQGIQPPGRHSEASGRHQEAASSASSASEWGRGGRSYSRPHALRPAKIDRSGKAARPTRTPASPLYPPVSTMHLLELFGMQLACLGRLRRTSFSPNYHFRREWVSG